MFRAPLIRRIPPPPWSYYYRPPRFFSKLGPVCVEPRLQLYPAFLACLRLCMLFEHACWQSVWYFPVARPLILVLLLGGPSVYLRRQPTVTARSIIIDRLPSRTPQKDASEGFVASALSRWLSSNTGARILPRIRRSFNILILETRMGPRKVERGNGFQRHRIATNHPS